MGHWSRLLVSVASPDARSVPGRPVVLRRASGLVLPELQRAVCGLHPALEVVARYHCGLTEQSDSLGTTSGGKMLRPALVLLSADTATAGVSTDSDAVLASAVAVQLVHEFSLLHDDIMDGDRIRRGRPAAWTVYGADRALLCGDALLTLAMATLTRWPACAEVLTRALLNLCAGQADDLGHVAEPASAGQDWERMAGGKTGALFSASCELGALLAGADTRSATMLREVGARLGLAFQAIDDWLGVWGDPVVTGKPVGSDLAARKHTLPVAIALGMPGTGAELRAVLEADRDLIVDDTITGLLDRAGAGERTHRYAERQLAYAAEHIDVLTPTSEIRHEWEMLINFLAHRIV